MWNIVKDLKPISIIKYIRLPAGILLILLSLYALTSCTQVRNHRLELQVKCPPETGGQKFMIPEILAGVKT